MTPLIRSAIGLDLDIKPLLKTFSHWSLTSDTIRPSTDCERIDKIRADFQRAFSCRGVGGSCVDLILRAEYCPAVRCGAWAVSGETLLKPFRLFRAFTALPTLDPSQPSLP
eukprot:1170968-Prorocentrum_minimum.AAC.3